MLAQVVHTTGINWDGWLANAVYITALIGGVGGLLIRQVNKSVGSQVSAVIDAKVTPKLDRISSQLSEHDRRISHLEGIAEGERRAVAAAGVTVNGAILPPQT